MIKDSPSPCMTREPIISGRDWARPQRALAVVKTRSPERKSHFRPVTLPSLWVRSRPTAAAVI